MNIRTLSFLYLDFAGLTAHSDMPTQNQIIRPKLMMQKRFESLFSMLPVLAGQAAESESPTRRSETVFDLAAAIGMVLTVFSGTPAAKDFNKPKDVLTKRIWDEQSSDH
ncbi:MAG: hypothetical protein ACPGLY_24920 [Rubripirellula sp.]